MSGLNGHDAFEARIARLNASRGLPEQPMQAGMAPGAVAGPAPVQKPVKLNDWRENIRYPATIVGAFVLGLIAVFMARYVRFHLGAGGLAGENADFFMLLDGALAVGTGFALKMLFRLEGKEFQTAQTAGVFAMVCTMHNLVHWAPDEFSLIFSPEWTEMVVETTEPKSILFRGNSFVFDGGETAKAGKSNTPGFIVMDSERG